MKIILVALIFFTSAIILAQDYSDPVAEGEIVVERPTDLTQSYRDRRNRFGVLFSVNYEKFYPKDYLSLIQNQTFDIMSGGDSIPIIGAELGIKFNFAMGSLSGILGYGGGTYSNESTKVDKITTKITKATLNFALDNLMSEPWVVPYGQVGASQIDWLEESRDGGNVSKEDSFRVDWNLHYKVGLLFQLNWLENSIDQNTHTNGLTSSGLQNTFLDVFYSAYAAPETIAQATGQEGDGNLQSDNFGVGLKLEF